MHKLYAIWIFCLFLQFDMLQLKYRQTHKQYKYIHVR